MSLAWHVAAFERESPLKPLDDYLRPKRRHIDFDDDDALGAALDRIVTGHAARDAVGKD